jgi:hypothetical protein
MRPARGLALDGVHGGDHVREPQHYGPALAFTTASEVLLQRPNKLAVVTAGDGPATEFYYDGKTMTQFSPAENLVAVADAPPTIDAMLKTLYDVAGTYFPFTDVVVTDPGDIAPGLELAFSSAGPASSAGSRPTWSLTRPRASSCRSGSGPRTSCPDGARHVLRRPLQLRHQVELSHWRLDTPLAAEAFGTPKAAGAIHIQFAHPKTQSKLPPAPAAAKKDGRPAPKPTPKP